jgi:hypothetical protein
MNFHAQKGKPHEILIFPQILCCVLLLQIRYIVCVLWKLINIGLCFQSYLIRLIREDTERQIEKLRQENSNNEYQIQDKIIELEQQCVCNFYFLCVVAWETSRAEENTVTVQQKLEQVQTCQRCARHVCGLFIYNFFGHACNWVTLIAFKILPSYIDALLPMPLPLLETFPGMSFSGSHIAVCKFSIISWIVWNHHPFEVAFSLGNKKKSFGARSGE